MIPKTMLGWDHAVSANPEEMKIIVEEGEKIITALGKYTRVISKVEMNQRNSFRTSIVSKQKLRKGEVIKESKLNFKRPGTGIRPDEIKYILGRNINKDINEDELIKWEDLD